MQSLSKQMKKGIKYDKETNDQRVSLSSLFSNPWPFLIGAATALCVIGFYLGLLTLTSDWYFAKVQFSDYRWWIIALAIGLGVQAILYSILRIRLHGGAMKGARSSLAASGGMSAVSMAACCAHYLVAFLPALGLPFLTAATTGLDRYQTYFFMVGVLSNLFGIGFMLRLMAKNGIMVTGRLVSRLNLGFRR